MTTRTRMRARVEGTVQGVGFRPFVYRLAGAHGLAGWVLNDERGVLLEVEGESSAVSSFLERLSADAPPLAAVERVAAEELAPRGERGFAIVASETAGSADALVSPDSATCADCLRELFDPADRRHRYPFINCTNCGPRFTIVRGVPYDPSAHHHGRLRDVPGLPDGVRRPRRSPLSRPAQRVCALRAVAAAGNGVRRGCSGRRRRRSARGARARREGARRLPPRLRRARRDSGGDAALAKAPRGQALRLDGARPRGWRARSSS